MQTLAGGGAPALLTGGVAAETFVSDITATTRTVTIGANGILAPGDTGANERMSFSFTSGKLDFVSGATVAMNLGTVQGSDRIVFNGATPGDWLSGSGNATLALTLGAGFDYNDTYTIFENVSTAAFSFADITGYDDVSYTASFAQVGNNYNLSFTVIPEPSTWALLAGGLVVMVLIHRRRRRVS